MRVFIAGATGVLGHRLVARFTREGHDVVGLVRDRPGERLVRERGGDPRRADLFDADSLARAASGAEVVIHAATAIPTKTRTSAADWHENDRIRREGTEALATAAGRVGADRYLQQSVAMVARPPDGSAFDEDSVPHPDRTTQSALDGERLATRIGANAGFGVSVLRCGLFYAPDAAHTRTIGEGLRARRMPILGGGPFGTRDAVLSVLHADDAASAFLAAATADGTGLWHVVDDVPVTFSTLLRAFARRLNAPPPRRIPGWLAIPLIGRDAVRSYMTSMRTTNERFKAATGWEPAYPSYREGLDQIVGTWREEGTVRTGRG